VLEVSDNVATVLKAIRTTQLGTRMSWVPKRVTITLEGMKYFRLGISGINVPPLYGGDEAFVRPQEEIIRGSMDQNDFCVSLRPQRRACAHIARASPVYGPKSQGGQDK